MADAPDVRRQRLPADLAAAPAERAVDEHLRAGLDLQGRDGRRGAVRRARHARPPRSRSRRPSTSPTARSTTPSSGTTETMSVAADPLALVERRERSRSRSCSAATRLSAGSTGSGSASKTGIDFPAESPGIVLPPSDGRGRRSATSRSARASPSRRSRWPPRTRRSRTAACWCSRTSSTTSRRAARERAERRRVVSREASPRSSRRCSRDVVDRGDGDAGGVPGYEVAGKTGTAAKPTRTAATRPTSTWRRSSGSCRRRAPRLVILVTVDEPHGSIFGGDRRRAGVPGDREVRAAVPRGAAGRRRRATGPLRAERGPCHAWCTGRLGAPHGPRALDRRARAGRGHRVSAPVEVRDLVYDARRAGPGALFFCVPGRAGGRARLRPRGGRRGAPSRSSSSARSTCRCRSSSSTTRARPWRPPQTSSSATRREELARRRA